MLQPDLLHRTVECGCFMTPHYLLNLVHANMCNKPYPTTEFTVKDLKTLEVNRPNSTGLLCFAIVKAGVHEDDCGLPQSHSESFKYGEGSFIIEVHPILGGFQK